MLDIKLLTNVTEIKMNELVRLISIFVETLFFWVANSSQMFFLAFCPEQSLNVILLTTWISLSTTYFSI